MRPCWREVRCQDEASRVFNLAPLPVSALGFLQGCLLPQPPCTYGPFLWNREHASSSFHQLHLVEYFVTATKCQWFTWLLYSEKHSRGTAILRFLEFPVDYGVSVSLLTSPAVGGSCRASSIWTLSILVIVILNSFILVMVILNSLFPLPNPPCLTLLDTRFIFLGLVSLLLSCLGIFRWKPGMI